MNTVAVCGYPQSEERDVTAKAKAKKRYDKMKTWKSWIFRLKAPSTNFIGLLLIFMNETQ